MNSSVKTSSPQIQKVDGLTSKESHLRLIWFLKDGYLKAGLVFSTYNIIFQETNAKIRKSPLTGPQQKK